MTIQGMGSILISILLVYKGKFSLVDAYQKMNDDKQTQAIKQLFYILLLGAIILTVFPINIKLATSYSWPAVIIGGLLFGVSSVFVTGSAGVSWLKNKATSIPTFFIATLTTLVLMNRHLQSIFQPLKESHLRPASIAETFQLNRGILLLFFLLILLLNKTKIAPKQVALATLLAGSIITSSLLFKGIYLPMIYSITILGMVYCIGSSRYVMNRISLISGIGIAIGIHLAAPQQSNLLLELMSFSWVGWLFFGSVGLAIMTTLSVVKRRRMDLTSRIKFQ